MQTRKYCEFMCCLYTGKRKISVENIIFTCIALAKVGLVVGPLRPSGRPSVCLSVNLSVRNTLGVPSLCNL